MCVRERESVCVCVLLCVCVRDPIPQAYVSSPEGSVLAGIIANEGNRVEGQRHLYLRTVPRRRKNQHFTESVSRGQIGMHRVQLRRHGELFGRKKTPCKTQRSWSYNKGKGNENNNIH